MKGAHLSGPALALASLAGAAAFVPLAAPAAAQSSARPAPVVAPLRLSDVQSGVREFDRVYSENGMHGAQDYSMSCHSAAAKGRDWTKYDFCAAFDLAANFVDEAVSERAGWPANEYFLQARRTVASSYIRLTSDRGLVDRRLEVIKAAVPKAVIDAFEARKGSSR